MFRLAGLLLILGLALGLWVGFDAQEHQKVLQTWSKAKASLVNIQTQVSVKLHKSSAELNPGTQTKSISLPKPIVVFWRELSLIIVSIWNTIVNLWLRLISALKLREV
jgi:hypothetical protein